MTRDWKLIRAILVGAPLDRWNTPTVLGHYLLCQDKHLVEGSAVFDAGHIPVEYRLERLSAEGQEMATRLQDEQRLDSALATLDAQGVGHVDEFVLKLLEQ